MSLVDGRSKEATEDRVDEKGPCDTADISTYPTPPNSPTRSDCDFINPIQNAIEYSVAATTNQSSPPEKHPVPPATIHIKTKPLEPKIEISSFQIKALLGLGERDSRCGAVKDNLIPCKMLIPKTIKDEIDCLIEQIRTTEEPLLTFVPSLDKLVKLVHCRYHNYGRKNEPRIQIWNKVLCTVFDRPAPSLTIGEQILEALGQISTLCKGLNVNKEQCYNKLGGQKVHNCAKTLKEIMKREIYSNDEYVYQFLRILAVNMFCYRHLKEQSEGQITLWKESIIKLRGHAQSDNVSEDGEKPVEAGSPGEIAEGVAHDKGTCLETIEETSTLPHLEPSTPRFHKDPADYWPKEYEETPFEIIQRGESPSDHQSSHQEIKDKVLQKLDWNEQSPGYVYVYEVEGNPGLVKIGYTTRTLEQRHGEWEFDCNRKLRMLYPLNSGQSKVVRNARRVEALVHAELAHRKIVIYCSGCLKQHIEWFEVASTEAIHIVEKWSNWMRSRPYVRGVLKEMERNEASDMHSFLEGISEDAK